MIINHLHGRSVADTAAMAALTQRAPWSIRTLCQREDDGYDVNVCTLQLQNHPDEPPLLTAAQAQQYLGVPAGTVRYWASIGLLQSHQRDRHDRPLYDAMKIAELARITPGHATNPAKLDNPGS